MSKIFVVDEYEHVRDYVLAHFAGWGYQAESCVSVSPAVEMALPVTPDLMVLDINMAEMSGQDVFQKLAQKAQHSIWQFSRFQLIQRLVTVMKPTNLALTSIWRNPIIDVDTLRSAIVRLLS